MRGVVFLGGRKLELREFPDPTPGPGEVVVAGHEPCGIVAARGAGVAEADAPTGQRVMVHHYKGCGRCQHCRVGWAQLCRQGIVVYGMTGHGGHAAYMTVPAFTLVVLPDSLSFEEGAAISCGTGTAYGALKRLDVSGRDTLAVFGQGPVGLSATMLGRDFGAEAAINAKETDPVAALRDLTHGEGVETAMDCTGNPDARVAAVRSAT